MIALHRATLSLAVAAALALALASGRPASASAHVYIAKSTPIVAKGTNSFFVFGELILHCKKTELTYIGLVGSKFATIEMTPAFKECSAFESPLVITVNKAHYEFGALTRVEPGEFKMKVPIVGETGAQLKLEMTIEGEKCEVIIPAQKPEGESTRLVDSTGGEGAEIHIKLSGLEYKSNNKCAGLIGKEGKNASYEGSVSEKGLIAE